MKYRTNVLSLLILFQLLTMFASEVFSEPAGLKEEWPSSPLEPYDVAILSDNSVWFTHYEESRGGELHQVPIVFTIDPSDGSIKRCDEPFSGSASYKTLDKAPDDTLWIADSTGNRIVHYDPAECDDPATEDLGTPNPQADAFDGYPLPTLEEDPTVSACTPYGISVAEDGLVWVTCDEPRIFRFDAVAENPEDAWKRFNLRTDLEYPQGPAREIAFGPDGTVWFTSTGHPGYGGNASLGRLNPDVEDGDIRPWSNPEVFPADCFRISGYPFQFHGIAVRDGIVWFIDRSNSSLLSYDPIRAEFGCFSLQEEGDVPWDIHYFAQDHEGVFWLSAFAGNAIYTFDPDTGNADTLPPTDVIQPMGISIAPSGDIWWAAAGSPTEEGVGEGVGRFRPSSILLRIKEPTRDEPAWAQALTDTSRVFVRLVGAEDLDMSEANLTLRVGDDVIDPGQIVLHSVIESETWLVIRPGARSAQCYDLSVTLNDVEVSATAEQSLCYQDAPNRAVDRVLTIDRTNSMNYDSVSFERSGEKMNAARDAGEFFVDLSNNQDRVGVVSFQRTDENGNGSIEEDEFSGRVAPLTPVADEDAREDLQQRIRDIEPGPGGGSETSLGAALLEARAMFDPLDEREKIIVLVTDGRENFPPFWSSESLQWYEGSGQPVKGQFEDAGIRIDTVSIGLDAENAVLHDMSELTGGTIRNELEGTGSFGLLSRLSKTFKAIDEDNRGEQRFYYREGWPDQTAGGEFLEIKEATFEVEDHLDWMTVAFYWNRDGAGADLRLFAPGEEGEILLETTRKTQKHVVYHLPSPPSGMWRYQVTVNDPAVEFFAAASGPTLLTARLRIGGMTPGEDGSWITPIRVWIAEESAVQVAEVMATIRRPDKRKYSEVLRDEGTSADGGDGDGVYGTLVSDTLSGPYSVDVVISGIASTGEPFERFLSGAFIIPGEPDSPGQVGEEVSGEEGRLTKFCGGPAWCCWLWVAFIVALIVTLVMMMRILCHFMKEGWWTKLNELIAFSLMLALTVSLGGFLITYCTIALCWLLLTVSLAVIISGLIACFTDLVPCMGWAR